MPLEVPPKDLLPWRSSRASPYLYSQQEIAALMEAASRLRAAASGHLPNPHRAARCHRHAGREAIGLDRHDFNAEQRLSWSATPSSARRANFRCTQPPPQRLAATSLAGTVQRKALSAVHLDGRHPTALLQRSWTFQRLARQPDWRHARLAVATYP